MAAAAIGMIILPHAMAEAEITTLGPEYGLYTAFIGLLVYPFFATSKDVSLGPSAILCLLTAQFLSTSNKDPISGKNIYPPLIFAAALALVSGIFQLIIGLFRMGVLVDLLPTTVISAFASGAAITIIIGQIPGLLGITGINSHSQPSYLVFRDTLLQIKSANLDAAFGVSCLILLIIFKQLKKRGSSSSNSGTGEKILYFLGIAANGIVLILFTLISFLVARFEFFKDNNSAIQPSLLPFKIVGDFPHGLIYLGLPAISGSDSWSFFTRVTLPAFSITMVAIVEQISASKTFARKNAYKISTNQEIIAIGVANTIGPLFGAFPTSASFSRSAVKSASGVQSPASGWFAAGFLALILYFASPVIFFIPKAILPAVIIVSISDLVEPITTYIQYWNVSSKFFFVLLNRALRSQFNLISLVYHLVVECIISIIGLLATLLFNVEIGLYSSFSLSIGLVIYRLANGHVSVLNNSGHFTQLDKNGNPILSNNSSNTVASAHIPPQNQSVVAAAAVAESIAIASAEHHPSLAGIQVFKIGESMTFFNATTITDTMFEYIQNNKLQQATDDDEEGRVSLRSVIFEMSAVNSIDNTAFQAMLDLHGLITSLSTLPVTFHFVNVNIRISRVVANLIHMTTVKGTGSDETLQAKCETATISNNFISNFIHPDIQAAVDSTTFKTVHDNDKEKQFVVV